MKALATIAIILIAPISALAQETATPAPAEALRPAATTTQMSMPKWSEFPVPPEDVPTVADIALRVAEQVKVSKAIAAEMSKLKWDGTKPEVFTREARSRLDPSKMKAVDQLLDREAIEAIAFELRRRAAPPPLAD